MKLSWTGKVGPLGGAPEDDWTVWGFDVTPTSVSVTSGPFEGDFDDWRYHGIATGVSTLDGGTPPDLLIPSDHEIYLGPTVNDWGNKACLTPRGFSF